MNTLDRLIESANENRTILCFGIDPVVSRITKEPEEEVEELITDYFCEITETLLEENAISAIKPNYAFFAQYGFDGLHALGNIIEEFKEETPVIIDVKRGDIGKTSEAYAKEAYDFWGADAATINPYMGEDSVRPFLRDDKLAYLLCRTSNKGAKDFQELKCGEGYLYEKVLEKAIEWKCGIVVGATSDAIIKIVETTKNEVPMLIPGIGAQGGDLGMVMEVIKENAAIHRINASSSIAYAHEKHGGDPAEAAAKEAEKLNSEIRKYFEE
ncbi:orotidine-5'-phosphate decarboxylase [Candidatus Micrarchaeota archaeon]|nr:orotidine-5'-phosphate decarboxylase [Candidatus Micrarchaeota archaeon]